VSASILACFSALLAALYSYINWAFKKTKLFTWSDAKIKWIFVTNLTITLIALAGMIACLVIAGVDHKKMKYSDLIGENLWITAILCFVTANWAGIISYQIRSYCWWVFKI
ncbi:hypothetical protein PMAYCL1PPCAC_17093, partial [Pristionchus mayeri]